jgi:hypothetical protein
MRGNESFFSIPKEATAVVEPFDKEAKNGKGTASAVPRGPQSVPALAAEGAYLILRKTPQIEDKTIFAALTRFSLDLPGFCRRSRIPIL